VHNIRSTQRIRPVACGHVRSRWA